MDYDYSNSFLNGLNFEAGETPSSEISDLSIFKNADFITLDVFNGEAVSTKSENQQEFQNLLLDFDLQTAQQQQPSPQQLQLAEPFLSKSPVSFEDLEAQNPGTLVEKRKRNTIASARFRVKKKQKEEKMKMELDDLKTRISELNGTILRLEMENKCLKNLIVEKNEKKSEDLLESIKKNAGSF